MGKEPIKIETIGQLIDVLTLENVERFYLDFCVFIHDAVKIKEKFPAFKVESMTWTDDAIHEVTAWEFTDENGEKHFITKKKGAQ